MADHVSVKGKCVSFIGLLFIMQMVTLYETGLVCSLYFTKKPGLTLIYKSPL